MNEVIIKPEISICRTHGGRESFISIEISDSISSIKFLKMGVSFEEFSKLITGQTLTIDSNAYLSLSQNLGKQLEVKEILVPMQGYHRESHNWESFKDICKEYVLKELGPEWVMDDLGKSCNSHKIKFKISKGYTGDSSSYLVLARRWVGVVK